MLEHLIKEIQSGITFALQERLNGFRPNVPTETQQKNDEPLQKKRRRVPCTADSDVRQLSRYQCEVKNHSV